MKQNNYILKFRIIVLFLCLSFSALALNEGYYTIRLSNATPVAQGYVDGNRSPVGLQALNNSAVTQVWKIEKEGSDYFIKAATTGQTFGALSSRRDENGCPMILGAFNGGETQRWKIVNAGSGSYYIRLALNNNYVTASFSSTDPQPILFLTNTLNAHIQRFEIVPSTRIIRTDLFTDLRAQQTPYAHQGPRGTCTYFGSIAALEAAYKKAGYGNLNLSEQFYSIFAKIFYLHPIWRDITNSYTRENQFALTQGGGSVELLRHISIPLETVSPYSNEEDHSPYHWSDTNQRNCNNFNLNLIRTTLPGLSEVTSYYGVSSFASVNTINETTLENLLRAGNEIKICFDGHCLLLVGFDKTDASRKRFIVKDSYTTTGTPCTDVALFLDYSVIPRMNSAEYVISVKPPHRRTDYGIIGRWKLNFDGWKGDLDIYHIPGIFSHELAKRNVENGGSIIDRRLGTFYDQSGRAFRVNGSITVLNNNTLRLVFYLNNNRPNLRWDELSGRRFEYIVSLDQPNFMAGTHVDPDGRQYGGYAVKVPANYYSTEAFTPTGAVHALHNREFLVRYRNMEYQGSFNSYNSLQRAVSGTFTAPSGHIIRLRMTALNGSNSYNISVEGTSLTGRVINHSWEPGIFSGNVSSSSINAQPICLIRRTPPRLVLQEPIRVINTNIRLRTGELEDTAPGNLKVYGTAGTVVIDDPAGRAKDVTVYSTSGAMLMRYDASGHREHRQSTELEEAVYIVMIRTEDDVISEKVFLSK